MDVRGPFSTAACPVMSSLCSCGSHAKRKLGLGPTGRRKLEDTSRHACQEHGVSSPHRHESLVPLQQRLPVTSGKSQGIALEILFLTVL